MGESSTPRRPTHDTNTSRRQVNTNTHNNSEHNNNNNNTSSKQSKYKHTMKFTGLIASTMMLLVVVMTSTASALSIERPPSCEVETRLGDSILVEEVMHGDIRDNKCCWFEQLEHKSKCYQNTPIEPTPKPCCRAFTLECEACNAGVSEDEFCRRNPYHQVCPQKPTKPSHPDNCYSTIWNTEIMHGEMGARKCCWYGKWERKSKCETNPPATHPDNCYSTIWQTEIMHGEMGAKKCCWKGKWERKSKCETNPPHSPTPEPCCRAFTLECEACNAGVSEDEFCRRNPHHQVCPQKPTKPSHPDNCYSTIWNTEIMHGEMGAKKCCWYGKWERKSKCS